MKSDAKALIMSLGGTPAPLIKCITEEKPTDLVLFESPGSEELEWQVLSKVGEPKPKYAKVLTKDAQDIVECYRALDHRIPEIFDEWGLNLGDAIVDYTGGTKSMSAALVLYAAEYISEFRYVGAKETDEEGRTKKGLGPVATGHELVLICKNPWEALAIRSERKAALYFNRADYRAAKEEIDRAVFHLKGSKLERVYALLSELIEGYYAWDCFRYQDAKRSFENACKGLPHYLAGRPGWVFRPAIEAVESLCHPLETLQKLAAKKGTEAAAEARQQFTLDLISNAWRRATLEGNYGDACARLYNALERVAQNALLKDHEIDASDVNPEKVPESLRNKFVQRYTDRYGKVKLPLTPCYELLAELGDRVGVKYTKSKKELDSVLGARNASPQGHGHVPVKKEDYEKLLGLILHFADISEDDIVKFPVLNR